MRALLFRLLCPRIGSISISVLLLSPATCAEATAEDEDWTNALVDAPSRPNSGEVTTEGEKSGKGSVRVASVSMAMEERRR